MWKQDLARPGRRERRLDRRAFRARTGADGNPLIWIGAGESQAVPVDQVRGSAEPATAFDRLSGGRMKPGGHRGGAARRASPPTVADSFKTRAAVRWSPVRMTMPDLDSAARFLAASGRVLDRRLFERLFMSGPPEPVRDAVAAYRNPDGGLGWGLEPDGRTPASQPAAIEHGLRVLHEADAWDDDLVAGVCGWLEAQAPAEGGAAFVEPTVEGWPHAPWWQPEEDRPASLITTGQIAGTLHARGVVHPWLERATKLLWSRVDLLAGPEVGPGPASPYDMRGVLRFLQYVPDRRRAERAFDAVGPLLIDRGLVALDPDAPGEVHSPLDFAPEPDSLARRLFDQQTIEAHLDHLARGQVADGGWTFNWQSWSRAAELEWRGWVTVEALRVLRANGRLPTNPAAAGRA